MLFPVIKVKDGDYIHIVGTNSHDRLYIDEKSGGIQYLNIQCNEGTQKINGKASMDFVANKQVESIDFEIEFVTLEELIHIATENMVRQTNNQVELHKMLKETMTEYLETKRDCDEKLRNSDLKDSSGRLF